MCYPDVDLFDSNQHVPLLRALLGLAGGLVFRLKKEKGIMISSQQGTEEMIRLHGCGCGCVSFFVADMFALQGSHIIRVLFTVVSWLPVPLV